MKRHARLAIAFAALAAALVLGSTVASAVAPLVTVENATEVGFATASVEGTIDPQGEAVNYEFQYITDAAYQGNIANSLPPFEGASTGPAGTVEGSGSQVVSGALQSLTPGTAYRLRLLAANPSGEAGEAEATAPFTTKAAAAPTVTIDPVTAFSGTTAEFTGSVNPNAPQPEGSTSPDEQQAFNSHWRFECTPECPGLEGDVAAGDAAHAVGPVEATGLQPNTSYEVTLIATNGAGPAQAGPVSFKTGEVGPEAQTLYAGSITETSAILAANVNPHNSAVTYQFEWGAGQSYGNLTPATAQPLSAEDNAFHVVTAPISGLQPGATYHFRVVATNTVSGGSSQGVDHVLQTLSPPQPQPPAGSCPNEAIRGAQGSTALPECGAYEMVSPLDKNGGNIDRDYVGTQSQSGASPAGDALAFVSRFQFGDIESGAIYPTYVSRRGASGWITEGVVPPTDNRSPFSELDVPRVEALSEDLSISYGATFASLTPAADDLEGSAGLYARSARPGLGYQLLSDPWQVLTPDLNVALRAYRFNFAASTPDSSVVIFNSQRQLLPDAPEDASVNSPNAVYQSRNGVLSLVSVPPPGTTFEGQVGAGAGPQFLSTNDRPGTNLVSDDGRRVFFTAGVPEGSGGPYQLFVREDGVATRLVSGSERAGDPPAPENAIPQFAGARASDGAVAFFMSGGQLTDDSTPGVRSLYRWDADAPAGEALTNLSPDPLGSPGELGVRGVAAVSDDAADVYFVATGVLADGALRGLPNLYRWHQGEGVSFIATLDPDLDSNVWSFSARRGALLSADGDRLLFASYARLDSTDNTEAAAADCGSRATAGDPCRQLYLYDAGLESVRCLTCVSGSPMSGDANFFGNIDLNRGQDQDQGFRAPRNLSADGSRVFFETTRRLLPADKNGALDVYRWSDGSGGGLQLVSTGRGQEDSMFLDASASGNDVFFTTRERLAGIDTDDQIDAYDARLGGGLAAQNPPLPAPPCQASECQGDFPAVPAQRPPASSSFSGPGNQVTKHRHKRRHHKKHHRRKHKKHKKHHQGKQQSKTANGKGTRNHG